MNSRDVQSLETSLQAFREKAFSELMDWVKNVEPDASMQALVTIIISTTANLKLMTSLADLASVSHLAEHVGLACRDLSALCDEFRRIDTERRNSKRD